MLRSCPCVLLCCGLLLAATGCPGVVPPPVDIEVRNLTQSRAHAHLLLDEQEYRVDVAAGATQRERILACIDEVRIAWIDLADSGDGLAVSFEDAAVQSGVHYSCGDRIVIEIHDDRVVLSTEPADSGN